jgi:hypothetical protein
MNVPRINQAAINNSLLGPFITAILGQRRVGKTFFIKHYAEQFPDYCWVFLNMDDMQQKKRIENGQLSTLIAEHAKQNIGSGKKIWIAIDEAQKCPELFDQIKMLYDFYKDQDKIKFILTGSALLSLHKFTAESLAGRIELHFMQEFTLREIAYFYEPTIPMDSAFDLLHAADAPSLLEELIYNLTPFKPALEKALQQQLVWGGFPELLGLVTEESKIVYLNNYLQTYLEKDVRAITTITDLNLYRNIMDIVAEQTGSLRDDKRITDSLGCTRDTLKKYRGYLEATLFYQDIYPFINSTLKRLVKSPKTYLLSNGLISILTGLTDIILLEKTGMIGHRLESWFLNELNTWGARMPSRHTIDYWRTSSGREVDFILTKKPYIFPFEITYQTQIDQNKVKNLKLFLQEEPKASWGYYIYRGDFKISHEDKIIFLPFWMIA